MNISSNAASAPSAKTVRLITLNIISHDGRVRSLIKDGA
jgi:hypothetical protein